MLEIKARLKIPRGAYKVEVKDRLVLGLTVVGVVTGEVGVVGESLVEGMPPEQSAERVAGRLGTTQGMETRWWRGHGWRRSTCPRSVSTPPASSASRSNQAWTALGPSGSSPTIRASEMA